MYTKINYAIIIYLLISFINAAAQTSVKNPILSNHFQMISGSIVKQLNEDEISVNELHMVPDSGRSGLPIKISYTINNTDQFSAFQFDILLPDIITLVTDSVWLFRKTDHVIIYNLVNQQTLRVLAFSPSNQLFTGNEGEIVRVMFNLNGNPGTYDVGLNNVVVSNPIGVNILTGYFPGYIKITTPEISGDANINFGEVSVLDTLSYGYKLYNTGNDTLFITEFFASEPYFWVSTTIPNFIPPFDSGSFILKFHNIIKGTYSATYTIRSNDIDEDPFYITATALSFAPNYIMVQNAEAYVRDTVILKIDVDNYEQFINFQVDLEFPDSLFYVPNSAVLTTRKQDHVLFANLLSSNIIRLYTESANLLPFFGDSGTVATMNFLVGNDTGVFPLQLSSGILFDSSAQNIIRGTIDGEIYIQRRPTFQLAVTVENDWNMVSVPGYNINGQGIDSWWSGRDFGTDVFTFNGGYHTITVTVPGEGYWMKHIGSNTYNTGDEWPIDGIETVPHYPLNALEGWNLKGGYEDTVQTSELTTLPPGLITGPIYGYYDGYIFVTELLPGFAYWIKLSGSGQIIFPDVLSKKFIPVIDYFKEDWGRITISDAEGRSYTLYAADGSINLEIYELPPKPPTGMFDVRFGSGRIAENLEKEINIIELSSVKYPFTLKVENMTIGVQDETGKLINEQLLPGDVITINDISINKLKVHSGEKITPTEYSLEQNYPNPFNPVTTIKYDLPNTSNVSLIVYDILGRKVTELVNTKQQAGRYEVQFSAFNIASGIYIYELRTDKFVSLRKMVLLK